MALSDLWLTSPDQLKEKLIKQIISFAGRTGQLRDGNDTSTEFRDFLSRIPSSFLARYAEECLGESFNDSGFVLQDIINQIGIRLGFEVSYGRYRGVANQIGFDGLWRFPSGHSVVVEVKTTDTYRIDLDSIAGYRKALVTQGHCTEEASSILMVVGRRDTGDLEAQIRGSRHAWDVRLISVDALLRLMLLKEEIESPQIIEKICAILIPREFTRVDGIIDIVFSATEDVKQEDEFDSEEEFEEVERKPKFTPVSFYDACITRIEQRFGQSFVRRSKATYSSPDDSTHLICAISKEHTKTGQNTYWFAFHPHQQSFLEAANLAFIALGCGSAEKVVLIPYSDFRLWLNGMNMTKNDDRFYWHISVYDDDGQLSLHRRKGYERIDLSKYLM